MEKINLKRWIIVLASLTAFPLAASTITTATCTTVFGTSQTQTDPSSASAQCSDFPRQDIADANGTVAIGSLAGFVSALSFDDASATVSESFTESFTVATTLTWNISVALGGPYAYVLLNLGPLQESYEENTPQGSGEWVIEQTLPAGDYTFSALAYVSDEGSAPFSASTGGGGVPEPGTATLLGMGLLLSLIVYGRQSRKRALARRL